MIIDLWLALKTCFSGKSIGGNLFIGIIKLRFFMILVFLWARINHQFVFVILMMIMMLIVT